jgi:hypothetical protein
VSKEFQHPTIHTKKEQHFGGFFQQKKCSSKYEDRHLLDADGQIFDPIGLHKTDAASDWFLIK